MKFTAVIAGGEGPDVWDEELTIDSSDILDACKRAQGIADDKGGFLFSIEQIDYEQVTDTKRIEAIERLGIEIMPVGKNFTCYLTTEEGIPSKTVVKQVGCSESLRWAIDCAVRVISTTGDKSTTALGDRNS